MHGVFFLPSFRKIMRFILRITIRIDAVVCKASVFYAHGNERSMSRLLSFGQHRLHECIRPKAWKRNNRTIVSAIPWCRPRQTKSYGLNARLEHLLSVDELLPTINVVCCAGQGRVDHDVYGERSDIRRLNNAPDGKLGSKVVAALFEFIAEK